MRNLIGMGLLLSSVASMGADGTTSQRMEDGHRVYMEACASCHDSGVDGAPITGQTKQWSDRSHLWEAVLFEHANAGYLSMPGKGGKQELSEYDVDAAAEYMLNVSHPDLPED
ncbi:MAG: c-type cytochrome [Halioglobus sp.]